MTSRRDFFKEAGGLLVGFSLLGSNLGSAAGVETVGAVSPGKLDAWLRISPDGMVQVLTGKVDIGMGVGTALKQIIAEELDIQPAKITFIMGDTAETPDQGGVGGSTSISAGARPLRNAAATARLLLVQSASAKLGVPVEQLEVVDGVVRVIGDPSKKASYGELAGGLNGDLKVSGSGFGLNVEGAGKPKDPSTYKVVGQSVPREDLKLKIMGQSHYAGDVRVPGMVHGRVIRPATAGATLVSADQTVPLVKGHIKTVVDRNFVGVVAEHEWQAIQAAKALKVQWSEPASALPTDLYAHMRSVTPKASRVGVKKGDTAAEMATVTKRVEGKYDWPFQAHATMGPGCAVVDFKTDGVTTVWCGSQKPHAFQKGLAGMLGVPENQVRIIWVEDAGSYGRAGYEDVAADAALLSKAVGKPVRVQWMRDDMTAWGGKGPATSFDLAAGFNAKGDVSALEFTSRTFSGSDVSPQANDAGNMLAGQLIGMPNKTSGNEFAQLGDASTQYDIPNILSTSHVLPPLVAEASPLRATHLRDPNGPAGTFAGESFMDELAAAAGVDPVKFRMKYVSDPRARAVLTAVAEKVSWQLRSSPKPDAGTGTVMSGRGVALALRGGTHVATVADVEVNRMTGAVKVKKLTCAHDCGLIVNPAGLRATVAANLIQSMSRALFEEVSFDRNNVTSADWKGYRVARASEIPEIDIVLINHPDMPPGGAGEPSSRGTAAAINNAIFDATGVRLRQAPLTAVRMKIALDNKA
jgi:nicotinate dehydrogenase subunit B